MIKELDRVVLTRDIDAEHLTTGDVGTVVHVYTDAKGYEVEFVALDGRTAAVVTLEAGDIRPVRAGEIPHARELTAA